MNVTIEKWISMVSCLLSPALPGDAIEHLDRLKPHLREFAATAFTADTARAVAEAERFGPIPGWDKIAPILRQAVRDARPVNYGQLSAPQQPETARPGPEEVGRIMDKLAAFNAEQKAREAASKQAPATSRDVTLKGVHLHAARAEAKRRLGISQ